MKKIAISTTLPIEVLMGTGAEIVDLNNRFVTSPESQAWLHEAEGQGFPKSLCAWIKGLYSACLSEKPDLFVAVTEGDCSNTKGLNAILAHRGIQVLPFGYPQSQTVEAMDEALKQFATALGVSWERVEENRKKLEKIRKLGIALDEMTFKTNQVSGFENHLWLVSFSDFNGQLEQFEKALTLFLEEAAKRPEKKEQVRLAYVGVPPMFSDLYDFTESQGARVVFNEVQRQFAMPFALETHSLAEQYCVYTYPYELEGRLKDIEEAIAKRKIDGVIHYTQAFCHRALDDLIIRDRLSVPVLTLEGDQATTLDGRSKLRLEAFIDLLKEKK